MFNVQTNIYLFIVTIKYMFKGYVLAQIEAT